jgi:hypothetical protein
MPGLVPFSEAERICGHANKLASMGLLHPVTFAGVAYLPEAEFDYLVQLMSQPPAPPRRDSWPSPQPGLLRQDRTPPMRLAAASSKTMATTGAPRHRWHGRHKT